MQASVHARSRKHAHACAHPRIVSGIHFFPGLANTGWEGFEKHACPQCKTIRERALENEKDRERWAEANTNASAPQTPMLRSHPQQQYSMQQQQMSAHYSAQQQQQHTPSQPQIRRQQQPSLSSAQAYQQHPQYQMQQHPQQQVSSRVARQPHGYQGQGVSPNPYMAGAAGGGPASYQQPISYQPFSQQQQQPYLYKP
mmetsp:Transcript_71300/g.104470  ORF Transcript_71300/g.104470 Transcript_71300/m.104470 type:complete len:198 (-) Transcript_71300:298-891(-)